MQVPAFVYERVSSFLTTIVSSRHTTCTTPSSSLALALAFRTWHYHYRFTYITPLAFFMYHAWHCDIGNYMLCTAYTWNESRDYELVVYIMISPIFMSKVHLSCYSTCFVPLVRLLKHHRVPSLFTSFTNPFRRLEIFLPSHPAKLKFSRSSTRVTYIYRTSREHLMHMARAFFQERSVSMTTPCRLLHHCRCINSWLV
jgi:hypothetical protein